MSTTDHGPRTVAAASTALALALGAGLILAAPTLASQLQSKEAQDARAAVLGVCRVAVNVRCVAITCAVIYLWARRRAADSRTSRAVFRSLVLNSGASLVVSHGGHNVVGGALLLVDVAFGAEAARPGMNPTEIGRAPSGVDATTTQV